MKRTYQPSKVKRNRKFGFRERMKTRGGRLVLKRRRAKGRLKLSISDEKKPYQADKTPVKTGFSFPRKEKLKGRDEIREVFSRRKGVSCSGAKLFVLQNRLPYNRIAFTFSRKYGNAVERNHSRRLSREAYRLQKNDLLKGYDLVLLVYPGNDSFSVRMSQLKELFTRAGLFGSFQAQELQ